MAVALHCILPLNKKVIGWMCQSGALEHDRGAPDRQTRVALGRFWVSCRNLRREGLGAALLLLYEVLATEPPPGAGGVEELNGHVGLAHATEACGHPVMRRLIRCIYIAHGATPAHTTLYKQAADATCR